MSPAGWLPVNRDQLRAQRSVTSMGKLYFTFFTLSYNHAAVGCCTLWLACRVRDYSCLYGSSAYLKPSASLLIGRFWWQCFVKGRWITTMGQRTCKQPGNQSLEQAEKWPWRQILARPVIRVVQVTQTGPIRWHCHPGQEVTGRKEARARFCRRRNWTSSEPWSTSSSVSPSASCPGACTLRTWASR